MKYCISTSDWKIKFEFNLQNPLKPHYDYKDYVSGFIEAIVEMCKKIDVENSDEENNDSNDSQCLPHCY